MDLNKSFNLMEKHYREDPREKMAESRKLILASILLALCIEEEPISLQELWELIKVVAPESNSGRNARGREWTHRFEREINGLTKRGAIRKSRRGRYVVLSIVRS